MPGLSEKPVSRTQVSSHAHSQLTVGSCLGSVPSRYNRTLREIIHDDIIREIDALQKRMGGRSQSQAKSPVEYDPREDDSRLEKLNAKLTEMTQDLQRKMNEVDSEVTAFLEHGLGVSDSITTSCTHMMSTQHSHL